MITKSARLRAQARELSSDLKEIGDIAKDAVQEQFGRVRENATECYEQGREKVCGAAYDFEKYVQDQPVKSVLIAAGVGLLFGRFWMRR